MAIRAEKSAANVHEQAPGDAVYYDSKLKMALLEIICTLEIKSRARPLVPEDRSSIPGPAPHIVP